MIVLDASIAVKWYLKEADSEKAESLIRGEDFIAPDLIRVEVAAALCKGVKFKALTAEECFAHHERWENHLSEGLVELIPNEAIMPSAVRLSAFLSHPLQDCLYLAVCRLHNAPLVTADRKLFDRAKAEQMDARMLADYGTH